MGLGSSRHLEAYISNAQPPAQVEGGQGGRGGHDSLSTFSVQPRLVLHWIQFISGSFRKGWSEKEGNMVCDSDKLAQVFVAWIPFNNSFASTPPAHYIWTSSAPRPSIQSKASYWFILNPVSTVEREEAGREEAAVPRM